MILEDSKSAFIALAVSLMRGDGSPSDAAMHAESRPIGERVPRILRAATSAAVLADPTWAGNLGDYRVVLAPFLESLRSASVFDFLLANGAIRLPMNSQAVTILAGASADVVGVASVKPVSEMELQGDQLPPMKASTTVVLSDELLKSARAEALVSRELTLGASAATDGEFLAGLLDSSTPSISGTSSFSADVASALAAMAIRAGSRPVIVVTPAQASALAFATTAAGEFMYPDVSPRGGTVQGVPVIVSDQIQSSSPEDALCIDMSSIVLADETVTLQAGKHANLTMDDAPGEGDAQVFNLWQRNCTALKAERWFSYARPRAESVVLIDGPSW